jgi:hypothetical protein
VKDYQDNSIKFDGQKAERLVQLRQQMDSDTQRICEELHSAFNRAEEQLKSINDRYEPEVKKILAGTELEGTPIGEIGFDFSKSKKYGLVFAEVQDNPLSRMFDILRGHVENGLHPGEESIRAYPKPGFKGWGTDAEREEHRQRESV